MLHVHLECHYCGDRFEFQTDKEITRVSPHFYLFSREFKEHVSGCSGAYWTVVQSVLGKKPQRVADGLNEAGKHYLGLSK